jgi:hypothetical protein
MKSQNHLHEFHLNYDFRLKLSRNQTAVFLSLIFLCALAKRTSPESVTLTTYYPSPNGVYNNMVTIGNTWLARDTIPNSGGNPSFLELGSSAGVGGGTKLAVMNGNVGINTTYPSALLDIEQKINVITFRINDPSNSVMPGNVWTAKTQYGDGAWMPSHSRSCIADQYGWSSPWDDIPGHLNGTSGTCPSQYPVLTGLSCDVRWGGAPQPSYRYDLICSPTSASPPGHGSGSVATILPNPNGGICQCNEFDTSLNCRGYVCRVNLICCE